MKHVDFDPKKHKGKQLYEIVSTNNGDDLLIEYKRSEVPFELAAQTPWFFVVDEDEI